MLLEMSFEEKKLDLLTKNIGCKKMNYFLNKYLNAKRERLF